jgi:hypothetical protein
MMTLKKLINAESVKHPAGSVASEHHEHLFANHLSTIENTSLALKPLRSQARDEVCIDSATLSSVPTE